MKPNKKGMLMVEAAIIYPLVIGSMIALIYIIISIYTAGSLKTNLNYELRKSAMEIGDTGTVYEYMGENFKDKYASEGFRDRLYTYEGREKLHKVLYGHAEKKYAMKGLFKRSFQKEHRSRVYVIDEAEYIRRMDMLKMESENIEKTQEQEKK